MCFLKHFRAISFGMPPIRNIIFDWSGTLVDDFHPVLEATNKIFAHYDKPTFTEEEFREKFFLPFPQFYEKYLPEVGLKELDQFYHQHFKMLQENVSPLPGAEAILEFCQKSGIQMFLLSTIHRDHWEVQSERLRFKLFFEQAYVEALDKRKTIKELIQTHQIKPEETLFVGDMQHDIETAKHGGVQSCAVLTGYDSLEKLKKTEPDLIFKDLQGVQTHLERHANGGEEKFPIGTVGALIMNGEGKLLMIQTYKWSNKWGIPGGKIKWNETAEQALIREIKEETNLDLFDIEFVMVQDCIRSDEFFKPAHFLLLNYLASSENSEVTLNEEADEFKWVSYEEAFELPLNKPTRILLETAKPLFDKRLQLVR